MRERRIQIRTFVPSTYMGKQKGARQATEHYYQEKYPEATIEVAIDARKFASGGNSKRNEQPVGISNKIGIAYAQERVQEFENDLKKEGYIMEPGIEYVIVGQESFLKFHPTKLGFYDHTAASIKNLTTGEESVGVSDGVRFPMRDVITTALKRGGFRDNTVGQTYSERMLQEGIEVNPQDPYPSMGYESRDIYLEQASDRAYQNMNTF